MDTALLASFQERLGGVPVVSRRLLCLIARQSRGQSSERSLCSKEPGIATLPEVHEACGLDPDQLMEALRFLERAGLVAVEGEYPFQELRAAEGTAVLEDCVAAQLDFEDAVVNLKLEGAAS